MKTTAVVALLLMLAVDAVILIVVLRQERYGSIHTAGKRPPQKGIPSALLPRKVGVKTFGVTALASSTVVFGSALLGLPLWAIGLMALLPWFPLYVFGASWQYRHCGAFALFGTLVLLQLGHLSEHVVQNLSSFSLMAGSPPPEASSASWTRRRSISTGTSASGWGPARFSIGTVCATCGSPLPSSLPASTQSSTCISTGSMRPTRPHI